MEREELDRLALEAKQSAEAFGRLYDEFQPKIYGHAARWVGDLVDAEDITAQVFERALRSISGYDPDKASFYTWLFKIMVNTISDYFREKGKIKKVELDQAERVYAAGSDRESDVERLQGFVVLHGLLLELPLRHQTILVLRYAEEMADEDIARLLGCSRGNVAVKAHRALKALRKLAIKRGVLEELTEERTVG